MRHIFLSSGLLILTVFSATSFAQNPSAKEYLKRRQEIRTKIISLQTDLKELRSHPASENERERNATKKKLLQQEMERLTNRIEYARTRLMKADHISKEEKNRVLSDIETTKAWIEELNKAISKINPQEPKSRENLQKLTERIQKEWEERQKVKFRRTIGQSRILGAEELTEKAGDLIKNLEQELSTLERKGIDTQNIRNEIEEAKNQFSMAKEKQKLALEGYKNIDPEKKSEDLITQAQKYLEESYVNLQKIERTAQSTSRIIKSLKK